MKLETHGKFPKLIERYLYCARCMGEGRTGVGSQSLEVGLTQVGLQVWCARHKMNIVHFEWGLQELPECAMCKAGVPHEHR